MNKEQPVELCTGDHTYMGHEHRDIETVKQNTVNMDVEAQGTDTGEPGYRRNM